MTDLSLQFPDQFKRLAGDEKVLLAVSGGVDSMVMFHLCVQHKFPIVVLHCNFQLRGEESDADAFFVKNAAEAAGVPFYSKSFETAEIAEFARNDSIYQTETVAEALKIAREVSSENDLILVTGSLYLVGEAQKILSETSDL